jgi:hypothetical protein
MILERLVCLLNDEKTSLSVVAEQSNVLQIHGDKAEGVAFALQVGIVALGKERHAEKSPARGL